MMRKSTVLLVVGLLSLGMLPVAPAVAAPIPVDVNIVGRSYDPDHITVERVGEAHWHNTTGAEHTATAVKPFTVFNTGTIAPAGTGVASMDFSGTYAYRCKIHPKMSGTVKIPMFTDINPSSQMESVNVVWGSPGLPKGLYFQVQERRNGNAWKTIYEGRQGSMAREFHLAGAWQLHVRLVHRNSGEVGKWSPIYDQTVIT